MPREQEKRYSFWVRTSGFCLEEGGEVSACRHRHVQVTQSWGRNASSHCKPSCWSHAVQGSALIVPCVTSSTGESAQQLPVLYVPGVSFPQTHPLCVCSHREFTSIYANSLTHPVHQPLSLQPLQQQSWPGTQVPEAWTLEFHVPFVTTTAYDLMQYVLRSLLFPS